MSRAVSTDGGGARAASASGGVKSAAPKGYFRCTELPLTTLAFLLPLIVIYEVGTRWFLFDPIHQTEQRIIAFDRMQRFFWALGATGRYMPALAVTGMLLAWHIARGDPWRIKIAHVGGMAVESAILSIPLMVLGVVAARYLSHISLAATWNTSRGLLILGIGAGIYEELAFRLAGFALLSFILVDVLAIKHGWASLFMVVISAFLFSAYHYLGDEAFHWRTFAFRAIAGIYFGVVFLCRGFGITSGSHAAYDILIVVLRMLR